MYTRTGESVVVRVVGGAECWTKAAKWCWACTAPGRATAARHLAYHGPVIREHQWALRASDCSFRLLSSLFASDPSCSSRLFFQTSLIIARGRDDCGATTRSIHPSEHRPADRLAQPTPRNARRRRKRLFVIEKPIPPSPHSPPESPSTWLRNTYVHPNRAVCACRCSQDHPAPHVVPSRPFPDEWRLIAAPC